MCVPRTGDVGGTGRIRVGAAATVAIGVCQGGETVLGSHRGYGFAMNESDDNNKSSLKADCNEWNVLCRHFFIGIAKSGNIVSSFIFFAHSYKLHNFESSISEICLAIILQEEQCGK